MSQESDIFELSAYEQESVQGFHSFNLLKTTTCANIYTAHKDGKRFLIKTTKDNSERQHRILQREYELSIECENPHLAHIYTIEKSLPIGLGIVMEYIEGRTLGEYLAENPPRKELKRIFGEMLSAVEYLHKRGIIHNDIKPDNILITRADNTLKVIDFGLADSDAEYALRTLGCTPRYASPELQARHQRIDARSDIYSIGVIMEQMFGSSYVSRRCLRAEPSSRYANIASLRGAWHRYDRRWMTVLNILIVLSLVAAIGSQLASLITSQRASRQRTELLSQMESELTHVYNDVAEEVASAPYLEFAHRHISSMWEQCDSLNKAYMAQTDDPELQSVLATRYGQLYQQYHIKLVEMSSTLPAYHGNVELEEMLYYDLLIEQDLPYTPYHTK